MLAFQHFSRSGLYWFIQMSDGLRLNIMFVRFVRIFDASSNSLSVIPAAVSRFWVVIFCKLAFWITPQSRFNIFCALDFICCGDGSIEGSVRL